MPGTQAPGAVYRFGPFEVDAETRSLRKRGLRIQVRGQSVEFLLALLERPGLVVTREELKRRLWPEGIFAEFEDSLNSVANRLRDALGDRAARPKYIETLPRVGYRFVGSLARPASQAQEGRRYRLVVLPFLNLSGDSGHEYVCDGLTEEMIGQLACIGGPLSVIARTTAMHYKGTRKTANQIARDLKVDYVLEGSLRLAGERVRITAQLIAAAGEHHLWAKNYDGGLGDVLRLQEQVAQAVAAEIRCSVAPPAGRAVSAAAMELYIQGRVLGSAYPAPDFAAALKCLEQAVALEPEFAKAWAWLAESAAQMAFWDYAPSGEAYPRARQAAQRALELDAAQAEAHRALGWVHWYHDWDLPAARREFERAAELSPGDSSTLLALALFHGSMRLDLAAAGPLAERALELDPLAAHVWGHSGWLYYWTGHFDRAISLARRSIQIDSRCLTAYCVLGLSLAGQNRHPEAIRAFEAGLQVNRGALLLAYLGMTLAVAGERGRAEALMAELIERSASEYVLPTCFAFIHLGLGETEAAMDRLEQAVRERDAHTLWLRTSPRWAQLRGHPRFDALIADVPTL
jgi:TolB-like protein